MKVLTGVGFIGFFACLIIMYTTNLGIPGIREYDANFNLLDMQFHYNHTTVYENFDKIGVNGRIAYHNYWILDFFFIACFLIVQITVANSIAMSSAFKNALVVLSVFRAVFDVIENGILIYLIGKFPTQNNQLASLCSYVTTSKFIALYLWLLGRALALFHLLMNKFEGK